MLSRVYGRVTNNNGFLDWVIGFIETFFTIHSWSQSFTITLQLNPCLVWSLSVLLWNRTDSILIWSTAGLLIYDWLERRNLSSTALSCLLLWLTWFSFLLRLTVFWFTTGSVLSLSRVTTDVQSANLSVKHPSGASDQIFITVRQLRVCWCGALSLTRRRVCSLQLLLALASAIILGS
jgi:hypothetical protein